jgi:hypothetical protein
VTNDYASGVGFARAPYERLHIDHVHGRKPVCGQFAEKISGKSHQLFVRRPVQLSLVAEFEITDLRRFLRNLGLHEHVVLRKTDEEEVRCSRPFSCTERLQTITESLESLLHPFLIPELFRSIFKFVRYSS